MTSSTLIRLSCIAIGGATGSVIRYLISDWIRSNTTTPVPLGTITVNLIGCFLIGFLMTVFTGTLQIRDEWRLGLIVGVLGGFTTFSAYALESIKLIHAREWMAVLTNVAISNLFGILGVWLGMRGAQKWFVAT